MDKYFVQQTDDDGNVTYVEAELPGVAAIPDDAFYQDQRYRKVADSDAQRRLRIKELRKQVEALSASGDEGQDESNKSQSSVPEPTTPPPATEDLVAAVLAKLKAEQSAEQSAASQRKALIDGLMDKHKLPEEFRGALEGSTDPTATAGILGPAVVKFDLVPRGDSERPDEVAEIMKKVNEGLGFDND